MTTATLTPPATAQTSQHYAPCARWANIVSATTGDDYVVVAVPPTSHLWHEGIRYAVQHRDRAEAHGLHIVTAPLPSATPKGAKRHAFDGLAGCVTRRVSRATGTLVGVYRAVQAGMEDDSSTPWRSVCEKHGTLVGHPTLSLAMACTDPREWCDDCRAAHR